MKERNPGPMAILLAVPAAASLAAWAFEEISVLFPGLVPYAGWAAVAGLSLDACILGIGLALAALSVTAPAKLRPFPWIEILSSLPVIVFSSAPLVYALLEGRPEAVPTVLLAARSLRMLRLRRVLPGSSSGILAALAVSEVFRAFAGALLPDIGRYSASIRLLLLPEALLVLGAAALGRDGFLALRSDRAKSSRAADPLVGEDELAGLLGKRGSW
ncbi:MAG: hypothetical protein MZU95_08960 [Desulfomicrobium escambiense]|nr:hypothetical protein [Desulfomicrobium escambiense]